MWNLGLIPSANGLELLDMKDCNNPKCQIRWVDKDGKPTPDNDDAIGMAFCTYPDGTVSKKIPICQEHARRSIYFSNWKVTPFQTFLISCK